MSDGFTPAERAGLVMSLVLRMPADLRVEVLQALQRLCQAELARLWGERNDGPGHALREDVKG